MAVHTGATSAEQKKSRHPKVAGASNALLVGNKCVAHEGKK